MQTALREDSVLPLVGGHRREVGVVPGLDDLRGGRSRLRGPLADMLTILGEDECRNDVLAWNPAIAASAR
ncbi:hypothetical protein J7F03_39480 [Streptomyces sp. ISL-43]|uniref:hypothetical protein n=1 Tax=Streptomyces sp. ISL-43 TaxID=2819183 RepID=UPI001BEB65E7|nr:hypothetical protein [Streptomyces sp. ISL-43]MBT2453008.1 hypothetical protein [Streptomyces sp. ISL-43]